MNQDSYRDYAVCYACDFDEIPKQLARLLRQALGEATGEAQQVAGPRSRLSSLAA